jgi:hypothetical protein
MAATPNTYQSQGNTQAPPGYPEAPNFPNANFDPNPSAGVPANIDRVVQGMQIMAACNACGRAYAEGPEFLAHVQAENESPFRQGSGFGDREAMI